MLLNKVQLNDRFGRQINYLRLSVTDRCDFRCVYCMAPDMTFLPKSELLTKDELIFICSAFVELGVEKVRLTGGEPLIRHDIVPILKEIHCLHNLKELVVTTNGSQLKEKAEKIKQVGVRRINISLDSLIEARFRALTRFGNLNKVIQSILEAKRVGFESIKLNAVIIKGRNDDEVLNLLDFAIEHECDISFIEEMPLGQIDEHNRDETFMDSASVRNIIQAKYCLQKTDQTTGGPSKYYGIMDDQDHTRRKFKATKIGFISPHSENFCSECNRVRVTADGRLILCLGNDDSVSLRDVVRQYPNNIEKLKYSIVNAIQHKPEKHHFTLDGKSKDGDIQIVRFMNMTGG